MLVSDAKANLPPLDGLSCRWEPLPARNGHILSLIIKPAVHQNLSDIMTGFAKCLGYNPLTDTERATIATSERLKIRFPPSGLGLEVQIRFAGKRLMGWSQSLMECVLFLFGRATGWRIGPFESKKYMAELSLNTDHRKLGDSLQLVLDVSAKQLADIRVYLDKALTEGRITYGLHVSNEALMTCFVQDIGNSQHIHFVDGAGGGLSLAATDFKQKQSAVQSLR